MEVSNILMKEYYELYINTSSNSNNVTSSTIDQESFSPTLPKNDSFTSNNIIEDVETSISSSLNENTSSFQQYHVNPSSPNSMNTYTIRPHSSSTTFPNRPTLSILSPSQCPAAYNLNSPNWHYQSVSPSYSVNSLSYSTMSSPFSPFSPYSPSSTSPFSSISLFKSFSLSKCPEKNSLNSVSFPSRYTLINQEGNNKEYYPIIYEKSNQKDSLTNYNTHSTISITSNSKSTILNDKYYLNFNNIMIWHFLLKGKEKTPFKNGYYYGILKFSKDYPSRPPCVILYTPNGRLQVII